MILGTEVVCGVFTGGDAPRKVCVEDVQRHRPVRGSYDAVRDGTETVNLWIHADALDADAANSLAVRKKFRQRARYERGNSGQCSGIVRTQANYVIGPKGPVLRMLTNSPGFNAAVEAAFGRWCKAVRFASKLRTICRAKVGDGEGLALLTFNPKVTDRVKLGFEPIECDRLTAPVMHANTKKYVDGIHFDDYGNPTHYDILRRHPGASWAGGINNKADTYEAKAVCHWYFEERSGQHRGVPDIAPSLNVFGTGRRYREAVVASAETAADLTAILQQGTAVDGSSQLVPPFDLLPIEKRTLMTAPAGATIHQMKAEQPTTTYDSFTRSMTCEGARPLSMPYNIAACDSSDYSYSGGQLDHQTYFQGTAVEQDECEEAVVEKAFIAWYAEAVDAYGWDGAALPLPKHAFAWPAKPKSDPVKTANSRKIGLSTGSLSPSDVAAEDGKDFEDHLVQMAKDYGVTVPEMRAKLLASNMPKAVGAPQQPDKPPDVPAPQLKASRFSEQDWERVSQIIHGNGSGVA